MARVTTEALREVGAHLQRALIRLLVGDGAFPRPTQLARRWELDQTLCVRTLSALRRDDPLWVLHQLPSTGSLRAILGTARARGAEEADCTDVEAALDELEAAVASLGGQKANLDTLIGSRIDGARRKIEATSKQSIFRGMGNLFGMQCDVALATYFVTPSPGDASQCDELAVYGTCGLRRLRPELEILIGGRILQGDLPGGPSRAREALHDEALLAAGWSVALEGFSTKPFPDVHIVEEDSRLLYLLPGNEAGEFRQLSMFFASIDRHASLRRRDGARNVAPFISLPRVPSQDMLLDVFVHRDVWPGSEPRLEIGRGSRILTEPGSRLGELDRLDLIEDLRALGPDPRSIAYPPLPRYGEMLAHVRGLAGLAAEEFRLWRLAVKYPVTSLSYALVFPLPE